MNLLGNLVFLRFWKAATSSSLSSVSQLLSSWTAVNGLRSFGTCFPLRVGCHLVHVVQGDSILTPSEQTLWSRFQIEDIYRFLTGELDTVPEFQYNWTSVPRLQPLGPTTSAPPAPAALTAPAPPPPQPQPPQPPERRIKELFFLKLSTLIAGSFHLWCHTKGYSIDSAKAS